MRYRKAAGVGPFLGMDTFNTRQSLIIRVRDQYDNSAWEDFVTAYQGLRLRHHPSHGIVAGGQ